jgi:hypothetical protein
MRDKKLAPAAAYRTIAGYFTENWQKYQANKKANAKANALDVLSNVLTSVARTVAGYTVIK